MKNFLNAFIDKLRSDRRYMLGMAFVAAAVLIAVIFLIAGSCCGVQTDCKYPYTYREGNRRTVITLNGPFEEDCIWFSENRGSAVVTVSEKSQDPDKAVFEVAPIAEGMAHVDFVLRPGDRSADIRYIIAFDFLVESENDLSVTGTSYHEDTGFTPVVSGTDIPYSYSYDSNTTLHVVISSDDDDDWRVASDSDAGVMVWSESEDPSDAEFVFGGNPLPGLYFVRFINLTDNTLFELPVAVAGDMVFPLTIDELSELYSVVSNGDFAAYFNGGTSPEPSALQPGIDFSYDETDSEELPVSEEIPDYLDPAYFTAGDDYVEPEDSYAEPEF